MKKDWELTDDEIQDAYATAETFDFHSGSRGIAYAAQKKLLGCFWKRLGIDEREMFLTWCLPIRKWHQICRKLGIE
ncbi:MAG: hypothetical protein MUP81_02910 [Dehalococcoidia bacterium]|nr:hypothetical protein [Dehalococcoidia bacterium]